MKWCSVTVHPRVCREEQRTSPVSKEFPLEPQVYLSPEFTKDPSKRITNTARIGGEGHAKSSETEGLLQEGDKWQSSRQCSLTCYRYHNMPASLACFDNFCGFADITHRQTLNLGTTLVCSLLMPCSYLFASP